MKDIPGFSTLKAYRLGRNWYIIDCTPNAGDPYKNAIGGHFGTYEAACIFALVNYVNQYE